MKKTLAALTALLLSFCMVFGAFVTRAEAAGLSLYLAEEESEDEEAEVEDEEAEVTEEEAETEDEEAETEDEEVEDEEFDFDMTGWWMSTEAPVPVEVTEEEQEIFDVICEEAEIEEGELYLVACLGTQVVAGTNYSLLTYMPVDEDFGMYMIIVAYVDFEGNVEVTDAKALFAEDLLPAEEEEEVEVEDEEAETEDEEAEVEDEEAEVEDEEAEVEDEEAEVEDEEAETEDEEAEVEDEEAETEDEEAEVEDEEAEVEDVVDIVSGGWTVNADLLNASVENLSEEAQEAWNAFAEAYEVENVAPVCVLATQVVAGVNYMYLAAGVDEDESVSLGYVALTVDPEGNVDLMSIGEFPITGPEYEEEEYDDAPVFNEQYLDYLAAEVDEEVVITTNVQAAQSWWDNKATLYCEDEGGAYFVYNAECSEELYEQLTPGTQVIITGYKSEWAGEVEIVDATIEVVEDGDYFFAEPFDATEELLDGTIEDYMNFLVSIEGATVVAANEDGDAFMYNWDGSGEDGNDLYFKVDVDGEEFTFVVESYLCGPGSYVYEAVKSLQVGDVIDMVVFAYWYEGFNPHVYDVAYCEHEDEEDVTVDEEDDVEDETETEDEEIGFVPDEQYLNYLAADVDEEVVITTNVQAAQSWWDDKATLYCEDEGGAYFVYNAECSEEEYDLLTPGTQIIVTGYKSEWAGEVEIVDATFEIVEDGEEYVAEPIDATAALINGTIEDCMNFLVGIEGATVVAANDNGDAFMYNWDGSGEEGNDLYFKVEVGGEEFSFVVESYLCGPGTDVYEAVKALQIGDVIDVTAFAYWYEGFNPHVVAIEACED